MGLTGLEGGTPVVMTGNGTNGDMLGGGGFGGFLLGALLSGNGGLFGGNRGNYGMNGGYGGYGMGYPAMGGGFYAGNVEGGQTASITSLQGQLTALGQTVSSNQVSNQMSQLNDVVVDGVANLNTGLNSIGRDLTSGQGNIINAITNGNFATLQNLNALGRDSVIQANNNALQQLNSFNQVATSLNQGFNEVGRDMNVATSQIIAVQNAMMAKNAECCCEIKSAIHSDGEATRALMNDIRLSELNAQLTDCKLSNSNLMQTNTLTANNAAQTSTILQHLSPFLSGIQGSLVEINNTNRNTNTNTPKGNS